MEHLPSSDPSDESDPQTPPVDASQSYSLGGAPKQDGTFATQLVLFIGMVVIGGIALTGLASKSSPESMAMDTYDAVMLANDFYAKNDTYVGWKVSSYVSRYSSYKSPPKITNSVVTQSSVCVQAQDGSTTVHTSASFGGTPKGDSAMSIPSGRYVWSNGPCDVRR